MSVRFITKQNYFEDVAEDVATEMLSGDYFDITSDLDKKTFRKQFSELKGKRIYKILVLTDSHPEYENIQNKYAKYKNPLYYDEKLDGAVLEHCKYGDKWRMDYAMGDIVVVYSLSP